ncbi:hypothetical protein ACO0LB_09155 [Undibacterium sp. SXout7W]|uniref:hypothetical protein n=1 Tax=Undibacterium sp. SXout7W TaxID=3413049 RepID=UPI003BF1B012
MTHFKPFSYLRRWLISDTQAVTVEQRLQNLALWQIVLIGLAGASVFSLCLLYFFGQIGTQIFAIGCALFMSLLIVFCWSLTFTYEMQRQARLLGISCLWICRLIFTALFFAVCYSPLLPPPRFLA